MSRSVVLGLVVAVGLSACTGDSSGEAPTSSSTAASTEDVRAPDDAVAAAVLGVPPPPLGQSSIVPVFADVSALPRWIVGAPLAEGGLLWIVVDDLGTATGVVANDAGTRTFPFGSWPTPEVAPALVPGADGAWELVDRGPAGPIAPVTVLADGRRAAIDSQGDLAIWDDTGSTGVSGPFLPDAYVVEVEPGLVAVVGDPTEEYPHAVLGDSLEGSSLRLIELGTLTDVARIDAGDRVIEGSAPLLVDVDQDLRLDLVLTTSSAEDGARVEVHSSGGALVAVGEPIGVGGRWRHVIGENPQAPGTLVEVVMPHVQHRAQLLRANGTSLEAIAGADMALRSHSIGSRNLLMAAVLPIGSPATLVGPSPRGFGLVARPLTGDTIGDAVPLVEREPVTNVAMAINGAVWGAAVGFADGSVAIWSGPTL